MPTARALALGILTVACAVAVACTAAPRAASTDAAQYYSGKTIKLVVAYAAGDLQDNEARLFAKYMQNYLPGKPSIDVQDEPGASGLSAVQFVHAQKADGLTLLFCGASPPVNQLIAPYSTTGSSGLDFDVSDFKWVGGSGPVGEAVWTNSASGIKSIDDLKAATGTINAGGTRPGSDTYGFIAVMRELTGAPIKIVTGYQSGSDLSLALLRNEIQIQSGTYATLLKARRDTGEAVIPLVILGKDVPAADQQGVFGVAAPNITTLARNDDDRQLITTDLADISWGQLMAAAPGTPDYLVSALRDAFTAAAADAGFKSDAMQQQLDMNPISGQQTETLISQYLKTPQAIIQRYVTVLGVAK